MVSQQILHILKEKHILLAQALKVILLQNSCFENDTFDEEYYEKLQKQQDSYIERIDYWNNQFEELFPKAISELRGLIQNNDVVALEIHTESEKLEELSRELEKEELELKEKFQQYLSSQRKEINSKRLQKKTAATYYKTMTKQMDEISYFYDRSR